MTTEKKVARRKLSLLELASDLGNVSKACKVMGYSRQQFYEIRRNFQTFGADGLIDRLPGPRGPHPNRVPVEIEQAILDHALAHPCHGPMRVSQELMLAGLQVSSGGVRGVWQRHGLLTKHDRLLRLEKATAERTLALSDEQIRLLERFSPEFRERHIEAPHTGALVAVDTFFVGVLKGVGKVYLQTAIDCHSRYAWARLYPNKLPLTAVQLMNNDVLATFEAEGTAIDAVLSDNGREFCGRDDQHPYELFLQLEGIAHKKTRVKRPQSNGIVERASTAPSSTSTSASKAAEPGSKRSRRCRRCSTTTSQATIPGDRTRAAACRAEPRSRPSATASANHRRRPRPPASNPPPDDPSRGGTCQAITVTVQTGERRPDSTPHQLLPCRATTCLVGPK
jgi:hypothetical protein